MVFNNNGIDDIGAKILAEGLLENTTVKHLVLSDNKISSDGIDALSESLKDHPTLESLFLQGNHLGTEGIQSLSRLLKHNQSLKRVNICNCGPYSKESYRRLLILHDQKRYY